MNKEEKKGPGRPIIYDFKQPKNVTFHNKKTWEKLCKEVNDTDLPMTKIIENIINKYYEARP